MRQFILTPKSGVHPENCMITSVKHPDGNYCVEIYNVFGDFHVLKPIQSEIEDNSHWHKYKNKRYIMSEKDMNERYDIINETEYK